MDDKKGNPTHLFEEVEKKSKEFSQNKNSPSEEELSNLEDSKKTDWNKAFSVEFDGKFKELGDISKLTIKQVNDFLYETKLPETNKTIFGSLELFLKSPSIEYLSSMSGDEGTFIGSLIQLRDHIQRKLEKNETGDNTETARYLEDRLISFIDRSQLLEWVGRQQQSINDSTKDAQSRLEKLEGDIKVSQNELKSLTEQVNNKIEDWGKKIEASNIEIEDSKKDLIAILGAFSSFIVIVMSLVITSSSWINNSDSSNIFIAFWVPSCIAVLAACALTALIRPDGQGKWGKWWFVAGATALVTVGVIGYSVNSRLISVRPDHHSYMIFETAKYVHDEQTTDGTGISQTVKMIEINYDLPVLAESGKYKVVTVNKKIPYDPQFDHDGYLFYCPTCDDFE